MTATPGRFCEAMVTTNSGMARLTVAARLNSGVVHTGAANERCTADQAICPRSATQAIPTASVSTTA